MADPNFSNVILLLNFQGADGSTTLTDSSNATKTVTAQGHAQIDTSDSDWPGGVMLLDGTGDKALVANDYDATDPNFGTGDFTVEAFIKTTSAVAFLFEYFTPNGGAWFLMINASGQLEWRVVPPEGGAGALMLAQTTGTVNTGAKVHVGVSRVGGTLYLVAGGSVVGSVADATDYVYAGQSGLTVGGWAGGTDYDVNGRIGPVRITKGIGRYSASYSVPTDPFDTEGTVFEARVAVAGVLGEPSALSLLHTAIVSGATLLGTPRGLVNAVFGRVSVPGMLGAERVAAWHDFTGQLDDAAPNLYVMDLVTPGGLVRVPISSWQATLQTDVQNYVQCVVPAATDWVPDIEAATEFVITRRGTLLDGSSVEYEMARAPAQTVSLDVGAYNYTATISGYSPALTAVEDPPAALDRTLAGVRTVSRNSGNVRVRCAVDWLLRPGQRAYLGAEPLVVSYVNYYVPGFDQYMDVGTRG